MQTQPTVLPLSLSTQRGIKITFLFAKKHTQNVYSKLPPPPRTGGASLSIGQTLRFQGGGWYVLAPKGWRLYWRQESSELASRGSDVVAPRTLCTGAKGKLLDCHKNLAAAAAQ